MNWWVPSSWIKDPPFLLHWKHSLNLLIHGDQITTKVHTDIEERRNRETKDGWEEMQMGLKGGRLPCSSVVDFTMRRGIRRYVVVYMFSCLPAYALAA